MSDCGNEGAEPKVGYGKPPLEHRFKPGQSGNPAGRPRKQIGDSSRLQLPTVEASMINQCLKKIKVLVDGKQEEMTIQDAIAMRLANDALKGDRQASKLVLKHLEKAHQSFRDINSQTYEFAATYKQYCQEELAEDARMGRTSREMVPHPDDIHCDIWTGLVTLTGPFDRATKMRQNEVVEERDSLIEIMQAFSSSDPVELEKMERAHEWAAALNSTLPERLRKEIPSLATSAPASGGAQGSPYLAGAGEDPPATEAPAAYRNDPRLVEAAIRTRDQAIADVEQLAASELVDPDLFLELMKTINGINAMVQAAQRRRPDFVRAKRAPQK